MPKAVCPNWFNYVTCQYIYGANSSDANFSVNELGRNLAQFYCGIIMTKSVMALVPIFEEGNACYLYF